MLAEDGLGVLELGAAGSHVARQKDVSVALAVQVVQARSATVGHRLATIDDAGIHRYTHVTARGVTFHTATHKHIQIRWVPGRDCSVCQ